MTVRMTLPLIALSLLIACGGSDKKEDAAAKAASAACGDVNARSNQINNSQNALKDVAIIVTTKKAPSPQNANVMRYEVQIQRNHPLTATRAVTEDQQLEALDQFAIETGKFVSDCGTKVDEETRISNNLKSSVSNEVLQSAWTQRLDNDIKAYEADANWKGIRTYAWDGPSVLDVAALDRNLKNGVLSEASSKTIDETIATYQKAIGHKHYREKNEAVGDANSKKKAALKAKVASLQALKASPTAAAKAAMKTVNETVGQREAKLAEVGGIMAVKQADGSYDRHDELYRNWAAKNSGAAALDAADQANKSLKAALEAKLAFSKTQIINDPAAASDTQARIAFSDKVADFIKAERK